MTMTSRLVNAFLAVISIAFFYGCHPAPKAGFLVPDEPGPKGYRAEGGYGVFENKLIKITVSPEKGPSTGSALLAGLAEKDYVLIKLTIENLSVSRVIYRPNFTALTDDAFDYRKPLDYTDMYDFGDYEGLEAVKDRFHDLDSTLLPGEKTSKYLIFRPLSKNAAKASLEIKELYIGTETVQIKMPFILKPKEG